MKKLTFPLLIYAVLAAGITIITLLLSEEVTIRVILSLLFVLMALTVLFGMICFSMQDSGENFPHNMGIIISALIYFIVVAVDTPIMNVLNISMRIFLAIQAVFIVSAAVLLMVMFMAKSHIENL